MTTSFERAFVTELRDCLLKVATTAPSRASEGRPAAPSTKPGSPFGAPPAEPPVSGKPPPRPPRPPGIGKAAGVPSDLERLYETIGPSAEAVRALRYATPRMDAHRLGRAAAKQMAGRKPGFGGLMGTGIRSADKAREVLEKGAGAAESPSLGGALRAMAAGILAVAGGGAS